MFDALNNYVNDINEAKFVDWLRDILEASIANAQSFVLSYDDQKWADQELIKPGVKNAVFSLSRAQVITSPDEQFSFTDSTDPLAEVVTPVLVIETINRVTTTRSAQGTRIYAVANFTITVLIARNGRSASAYKNELINMINYIEQILASYTGRRIAIGEIEIADIRYKDVGCASAVIPLEVSINNFDYTVE